MNEVLTRLDELLRVRKGASPESSYVAALYHRGLDHILKKIGEEATEMLIAAKGSDKSQVVHETADLWFHSLVMLNFLDISADEVLAELARREGQSGLEEKAGRVAHSQS